MTYQHLDGVSEAIFEGQTETHQHGIGKKRESGDEDLRQTAQQLSLAEWLDHQRSDLSGNVIQERGLERNAQVDHKGEQANPVEVHLHAAHEKGKLHLYTPRQQANSMRRKRKQFLRFALRCASRCRCSARR